MSRTEKRNTPFGLDQMTDERKYGDDEVREILDLAIAKEDLERPSIAEKDGLTLTEIQEAGLEVGVDPGRISEAAYLLEKKQDSRARRTSIGLPVYVGRTAALPRAVTDREWEVIVSVLRETFGAKGKIRTHGDTREWSHGTLQAFLEPTEKGHRLRLQTSQLGARFLNRLGATGLTLGTSLIGVSIATGQSPVFLEVALLSSILIGGGALLPNVFRLPLWARKREQQMEEIASRTRALIGKGPAEEDPTTHR